MVLTAENRRFLSDGHTGRTTDLLADIGEMDDPQLERLIRLTFSWQRDEKFLPGYYWRAFLMEGDGERGHIGAGSFFGSLYVNAGEARTEEGIQLEKQAGYEEVYPNLRGKLENIFIQIADECLLVEGEPTEEDVKKAQSVTVAGAVISFDDRWESVGGELTPVRRRPCPRKQELFDRVLALRDKPGYAGRMPYQLFSFRAKPPVSEQ